jgi:hypothetical protein
MASEASRELDGAYQRLEGKLPNRVASVLQWLRAPGSWWVRIPAGILCIIASAFWFLPIVGVEFLPIGLLLIAQDVPFLRRPVARMIQWLLDKWDALVAWWKNRRKH